MDADNELPAITTATVATTTSIIATTPEPRNINQLDNSHSQAPNQFKTSVAKKLDFDTDLEPHFEITTAAVTISTVNVPVTEPSKQVTDQFDNAIPKSSNRPKVSTNLDFEDDLNRGIASTTIMTTSTETTILTSSSPTATETPKNTVETETPSKEAEAEASQDQDQGHSQSQTTTEPPNPSNTETTIAVQPTSTTSSSVRPKPTFDPNLSSHEILKPNVDSTSIAAEVVETTTAETQTTTKQGELDDAQHTSTAETNLNNNSDPKPSSSTDPEPTKPPQMSNEVNSKPNVDSTPETFTEIGPVDKTNIEPATTLPSDGPTKSTDATTNAEGNSDVEPTTADTVETTTGISVSETTKRTEQAAETNVDDKLSQESAQPATTESGDKTNMETTTTLPHVDEHSNAEPQTENSNDIAMSTPSSSDNTVTSNEDHSDAKVPTADVVEATTGIPISETPQEPPKEQAAVSEPVAETNVNEIQSAQSAVPSESGTNMEATNIEATTTLPHVDEHSDAEPQTEHSNDIAMSTPSSSENAVTSNVIQESIDVSTSPLVPSVVSPSHETENGVKNEEKSEETSASTDLTTENPDNASGIFVAARLNVLSLLIIILIYNVCH